MDKEKKIVCMYKYDEIINLYNNLHSKISWWPTNVQKNFENCNGKTFVRTLFRASNMQNFSLNAAC